MPNCVTLRRWHCEALLCDSAKPHCVTLRSLIGRTLRCPIVGHCEALLCDTAKPCCVTLRSPVVWHCEFQLPTNTARRRGWCPRTIGYEVPQLLVLFSQSQACLFYTFNFMRSGLYQFQDKDGIWSSANRWVNRYFQCPNCNLMPKPIDSTQRSKDAMQTLYT